MRKAIIKMVCVHNRSKKQANRGLEQITFFYTSAKLGE